MNKKKPLDLGQAIGAIIFISIFIGLILLGIFYDSDFDFSNSFFDDVSEAIKSQQ